MSSGKKEREVRGIDGGNKLKEKGREGNGEGD